ncbi:hypothetical protein V1J52_18755 [Streptomyces sp. TRM 70351]|uniref:hypothetical protein n=1 Tax=Streptomyces sp. TRM 70351 TaxID=3116552 RepID=UPI002E7BFC3E|nr:hypothetical protein [Streptomyces sp. TRM 70351]MEE1930200.1 hypothetical protein [Streptomyces sp. TRM 70351]
MALCRHFLIRTLLSLGMPTTDYVVAGSGPLLAHGLRDGVGDLDVVARGAAWEKALSRADPSPASSGHGRVVRLFGGDIEVFDRWLPGVPEPDVLIDSAELVQDIPFCPLRTVLAWKTASPRPKDMADIALINAYLSLRRPPGPRH